MSKPMQIHFVSDVSCPWCAVGLASLQQALARLGDAVDAEIHFEPFELNPQMPAGGEDTAGHLQRKYGLDEAQLAKNRETIRVRGAELGIVFNARSRVYNTFDAHRLLHWAGLEGHQLALKQALLRAYFSDDEDISSHAVLVRLATQAGLDANVAQDILHSDRYAADVRERQRFYAEQGISAVPSVIVNDAYLIQGGQSVEAFEGALRRILAAA